MVKCYAVVTRNVDKIFTFTVTLYFVFMVWNYYVVFFQFSSRTPFSIACRSCLVMMKSYSFCFSGSVLISPSLLLGSFAGYRTLGDERYSKYK